MEYTHGLYEIQKQLCNPGGTLSSYHGMIKVNSAKFWRHAHLPLKPLVFSYADPCCGYFFAESTRLRQRCYSKAGMRTGGMPQQEDYLGGSIVYGQMNYRMIYLTLWSGWRRTRPNWLTPMALAMLTLSYSDCQFSHQGKPTLTNKCGRTATITGWRTNEGNLVLSHRTMALPASLEQSLDIVLGLAWWAS